MHRHLLKTDYYIATGWLTDNLWFKLSALFLPCAIKIRVLHIWTHYNPNQSASSLPVHWIGMN